MVIDMYRGLGKCFESSVQQIINCLANNKLKSPTSEKLNLKTQLTLLVLQNVADWSLSHLSNRKLRIKCREVIIGVFGDDASLTAKLSLIVVGIVTTGVQLMLIWPSFQQLTSQYEVSYYEVPLYLTVFFKEKLCENKKQCCHYRGIQRG